MRQLGCVVICGVLLGACSGTTTSGDGDALSEESTMTNGESTNAASTSVDSEPSAGVPSNPDSPSSSAPNMMSGSEGQPRDPSPDVQADDDSSSTDDAMGGSGPRADDDGSSGMMMPDAPTNDTDPTSDPGMSNDEPDPNQNMSQGPDQMGEPPDQAPGGESGDEGAPGDDAEADDDGPEEPSDMESPDAPPQMIASCEGGPLELPLDGCEPEFEQTGDFYEDCVARINQFRWECQCLPPLERWVEAESCADAQAQYDYEVGRAHAGINDRICEPGGGSQNECPGYAPMFDIVDFCLQQMWDEGPGEDFQAHGHYLNMSDTRVTKVACGRYETPDGDIWSVQNFSR